MIKQITICDLCGKSRPNYREHNGKLICSLLCWQEYWTREWTQHETANYKQRQANVIRLSNGTIATRGTDDAKNKDIPDTNTRSRAAKIRPIGG